MWAETGEALFAKVDPAVVAIQHESAGGSGYIVDSRGYIITNGHVVSMMDPEQPRETAKRITVILSNDKKYQAKVIGFSLDPDVALIKIEADGPLPVVKFADPKTIKTGQTCYAVGMPLGLKRTLTKGVISNTERTDMGTFTKVIQTDASINSGNSGGPLFNEQGEVLGTNTYSGGGQGLGFTIPGQVVQVLHQHFLKSGRFIRAAIPDLMVKAMTEDFAKAYGTPQGIYVDFVEPRSLAAQVGFESGQIIMQMDQAPISGMTEVDHFDFLWKLSTRPVGSLITFSVLQPNQGRFQPRTLQVTLVEDEPAQASGIQLGEVKDLWYEDVGLSVQQVTSEAKYMYGFLQKDGVRVSHVQATKPASTAGLMANDLIVAVNGVGVKDLSSFESSLNGVLLKQEPYVVLKVQRGNDAPTIIIKPRYDLKDKRIVLLVPPQWEHTEMIRRRLALNGAKVALAAPDGPVQDMEALVIAGVKNVNPAWAGAIQALVKAKKPIGAVGEAPLAVVDAAPSVAEKKMTVVKELSAAALQKKANYTGQEVESDDFLITTTGFDRKTVKLFLNAFVSRAAKRS